MQVISIDTLLQVRQGRGSVQSCPLPSKYHACLPESDALIHIGDRRGFSIPENETEDTHSAASVAWVGQKDLKLAERQYPAERLLVVG